VILKNDTELANTQAKLADLDRLIRDAKSNRGAGAQTELRSLQQLANQLREEIVRYRSVPAAPVQT
jgi:hypothetical protein